MENYWNSINGVGFNLMIVPLFIFINQMLKLIFPEVRGYFSTTILTFFLSINGQYKKQKVN
jgi:hypothetical protein